MPKGSGGGLNPGGSNNSAGDSPHEVRGKRRNKSNSRSRMTIKKKKKKKMVEEAVAKKY